MLFDLLVLPTPLPLDRFMTKHTQKKTTLSLRKMPTEGDPESSGSYDPIEMNLVANFFLVIIVVENHRIIHRRGR